MSRRLTAFALATLLAASVSAQEAKRVEPTGSIGGGSSQELSKKQVEIVRKVNAYFNQLTGLRGSFVQTAADSKRQRGKFLISRPGRFRFEFNLPSRVVIISDGKILRSDRDLNTDDRWTSATHPSALSCRRMWICFGTRTSPRRRRLTIRLRLRSRTTVATPRAASNYFWRRNLNADQGLDREGCAGPDTVSI